MVGIGPQQVKVFGGGCQIDFGVTRPEASDGTGTCRDTSGLTTPVTFNSGEVLAGRRQRKLLRMIHF